MSGSEKRLKNTCRRGTVLTIGTFDGVHRGHQAIVRKTIGLSRQLGVPSLAITFSRPPRLFFLPQGAASLLMSPQEKEKRLLKCGVEAVDVLRFGKSMAQLSAEKFFRRYLEERYHVRGIVVGFNFGFGRDRRGDTRLLEKMGEKLRIPVHVVSPVCYRGIPISSEQIRAHLREGDLARANDKLGEPYSFESRDDVYMNKYECCHSCYIQYVEDREERWKAGWRPK